MTPHKDNPGGYFESQAVRRFNDRLLAASQSNWRDWRPMNANWFASPESQAFAHEAKTLLETEFGNAALVMLKEPRMCRLMPFWQDVIEQSGFEIRPILTHRNPLEVAKSLEARDGIPPAEAMLLWLRHVLDAERASRGMTRHVTSYGALLENWVGVANGAGDTLGLVWPRFDDRAAQEIENFLSGTLRHHKELPEKITENPTLSTWIRESYEIFERWTRTKETRADHKVLDRIRNEFDAATPVFGPLMQAISAQLPKLETDLNTARLRMSQLEAQAKEHANLSKARQEVQAALDAERHRVAVLRDRIKERDTRLAEMEARGAEANWTQETLTAELDTTRQLLQKLETETAEKAKAHAAEQATEKAALDAERRRAAVLSDRIKERDTRLAEMEAHGAEANWAQETLTAELDTTRQLLQELEAETEKKAMARAAELATEKAALDAERRRAAVLEDRIKERDNTISEQSAQKAEAEKIRETLVAELDAARQREQILDSSIEDIRSELNEKAAQNAQQKAALEAAQNEVAQGRSALAQRRLEADQALERAETAEAARNAAEIRAAEYEAGMTEAERARSALAQRLADLEESELISRQELGNMARIIFEHSEARERLATEVEATRAQFANQKAEVSELERKLEAATTARDTLERAHDTLKRETAARIETLTADLAATATQRDRLEREAKDRERALEAATTAHDTLKRETTARIETLTADLAATVTQRDRLEREAGDRERALEAATTARDTLKRETTARIETLTADLATTVTRRDRLEREAKDRERELAQLAKLVIEGEQAQEADAAKIAQLTKDRDAARHAQEAGVAAQAKLTQEATANRAAQEKLRSEQDQTIASLAAEIEDLRNSTTWRMTKPARAVVDWLRGHRS
ncbi:hypothetical protein [Phaeobacter sp. J2-8]|uniref:hypothetical protein n=1 Tax=Phaeobacter sp. J2-8 TaxID=2931394 RepID=UPI001FD58115|nr:hypothetical protein [Phaeobacter sp. J2-8]MCJ7874831.1 hypothetical protein [Phaeobacter sp. J2-8]